uniref:Uncharacterized protein n=1 Tax=Anopheles christyi TaxID=43041 RepID=A0A182KI57_9DIPT
MNVVPVPITRLPGGVLLVYTIHDQDDGWITPAVYGLFFSDSFSKSTPSHTRTHYTARSISSTTARDTASRVNPAGNNTPRADIRCDKLVLSDFLNYVHPVPSESSSVTVGCRLRNGASGRTTCSCQSCAAPRTCNGSGCGPSSAWPDPSCQPRCICCPGSRLARCNASASDGCSSAS